MKIFDVAAVQSLVSGLGFESNEEFLIGALEVSGAGMLMVRKFASVGAVIACFIFSGAVGAHVTVLGFEGEMGLLFSAAMLGLAFSSYLAWSLRKELPVFGRMLS